MPIEVKAFDDIEAVAADADGALDRATQRHLHDRLEWFRVFSFAPRPKIVLDRRIEVLSRRVPHGAESFSLYAGHVVVGVRLPEGAKIELAMSDPALTAFLAWTEAAPPGPRSTARLT